MNAKDTEYFKKKLLAAKNQILSGSTINDLDDLKIQPEDMADEGDLANSAVSQQISFSLREKEMTKLRRIEAALGRIEEGTFGVCLESEEEIERKRLEVQPWAEYCLEVAEEHEKEQRQRRA